ncbi:MAG: hypothetical protein OQJ89_13145 [Kangiellaceae bacterium]|nr:hypothetical protein [Kangiellaceae bacterium]MCW9017910.1 hypothetical protein [Kangiellaceae bacterium]
MFRKSLIIIATLIAIIFVIPNYKILLSPSEALYETVLHKDYSNVKVDLIIFRGVSPTEQPLSFISILRNDNDELFEKLEPLMSKEQKYFVYKTLDSSFQLKESEKSRLIDGLNIDLAAKKSEELL